MASPGWRMPEDINRIAVLGAGTMGAGIAQTCSQAGYEVTMMDLTDDLVKDGYAKIRTPLEKRVAKGKMTQDQVEEIVGRIEGTTDLKGAVKGADFVIEAVFEDMKVKKEVYQTIDVVSPPEVVFATNTSSLSVTEMASVTSRPDRFLGMHFFNPAPVMRLVELIRGSETSDETISMARELSLKLGKEPVEVKETAGFVVNRILVPMMNEAFNLLMEGAATAEDIDKAMKLGTNMPMGPFELADFTGIDVGLAVMEVLYRETGDPKFRPSPLLRQYVRAGRLGRKSGRGVYDYRSK